AIHAVDYHAQLTIYCRPGPQIPAACCCGNRERVRPQPLENLTERRGPELRVVIVEALVIDEHDALGAVPAEGLADGCCVFAHDERDTLSAELACELAALGDQFERGSGCSPVHGLDERPRVVVLAGLLAQACRLVPLRRLGRAVGEELADLADQLVGTLRELTVACGRDV